MNPLQSLRRLALASSLTIGVAALALTPPAHAANDFSPAEQALFVDNHLSHAKPPLTLHYRYRKTGTLEAPFDDTIDVKLTARPDGACCAAQARFFSGAHEVHQPTVESAEGNPVILYFLERDIGEMERLTKGKASYFSKRIRMAIYQGAQIRTVAMPFGTREVSVREIAVSPYLDDPNRSRFDKLAAKRYVFMLSSDVPGGLYGIHTRIDGDSSDAPPLMDEELLLDPAASAPAKGKP